MNSPLLDVSKEIQAFTTGPTGRFGRSRASAFDAASDTAPIVQVVHKVVSQALRSGASDVHIEPQDDRVRIRFRIDGVLTDVLSLPIEMAVGVVSRIKILSGVNIVERRKPQDGQFSMTVEGREIDVRVATSGVVFGEKVVLRILDKTRSTYKLSTLGMPNHTHERYSKMIHTPFGMVICAGPTGSGKTTSLYASLDELAGPDKNVTTIEDPVEYVIPTINQIQINEAAGVTFSSGLRSILRQDPDIILVGEMRDVETARIAVQSALTGHLVMSSLHATDSVSALYRFLDMGIEPFLIASSVIGVLSQRLVRKVCESCKTYMDLPPEEQAFYAESGGQWKEKFVHGVGCANCSGTGYSGRLGVYELMNMSAEMRELVVRNQPSHEDMHKLALSQGMRTLRSEAIRLVEQDVTTVSEVVRTVYAL